MNNQTNEAVAWILQTGHGTVIEKVKPICGIDFWKPLGIIQPNTITITESEYAKLKADAERLDWLINPENVANVEWRKNFNKPIKFRIIMDGEAETGWMPSAREAIDQAIKEST